MRTVALLLASLALGGCYESYFYRPTQQVTSTLSGLPASHYNLPPEAPRGTVDVASFGLTDLRSADGQPSSRFLQVRVVVANNNDSGVWQLDTREQLVEIPGEGRSRAAYVNADVGGLPIINIAAGEKHTLDLYFPLPAGLQRAKELPQFDVMWSVRVPERVVVERTPFQRITLAPAYALTYPYDYGFSYGWGPVWWYDPFYPSVTFIHPTVVTPRARPIVVAPSVRGHG
jgi:hypothetical protein